MKSALFFIPLLYFGLINAQQTPNLNLKSVQKEQDGMHICFKVGREANVRHYLIEASTDSVNFQIISTLLSKGNTVLPRTYEFILDTGYYPFYRIKQIAMDGSLNESLTIRPLANATANAVK